MPKFNTTINNDSPLITYYPADVWHPGSPLQDVFAYKYAQGGTFTLTNATSATATISFNGTGIWIYGSKRPNHSSYQATFDGTTTTYDGQGDELNQQVIFSATDLIFDSHTVSLANLGSGFYGYLDVDYVVIETEIGDDDNDDVTPIEVMLSSSSSNFTLNGSGWKESWSNSALGTTDGMYTDAAGNSLIFSFTRLLNRDLLSKGSAITIYGSMGPSCGFYDVQIDGGAVATYNATRNTTTSDQLIFFGSNFGSGDHTIQITNNATNPGILGITRATVQRATDSTSSDAVAGLSNKAGVSNIPATAIIAALSAIIGLLLISIVAYFLWKRRRRQQLIPRHVPASKLEEAFSIDPDGPPPPPLRLSVSQTSLATSWHNGRNKLPSPSYSQSNSDLSKSSYPVTDNSTASCNCTLSPQQQQQQAVSRSRSPFRQHHQHHHGERITSRDSSPASDNESRVTGLSGQTATRTVHVCKEHKTKHKRHHHHHHHHHHHTNNNSNNNNKHSSPRAGNGNGGGDSDLYISTSIISSSLLGGGVGIGGAGGSSSRPLPQRPNAIPVSFTLPTNNNNNSSSSLLQQTGRRSSTSKFRRRSFRNSRIMRAGYNIFFAKPGSSNSGSAYAPSTVLTSEISERPATTLSPLTEVPPALPPIPSARPTTPPQTRPMQIVNQTDD